MAEMREFPCIHKIPSAAWCRRCDKAILYEGAPAWSKELYRFEAYVLHWEARLLHANLYITDDRRVLWSRLVDTSDDGA